MTKFRYAPVGNYYGTPVVFEDAGKFFFALEDVSDSRAVEISKAFFDLFCTEFDHPEQFEVAVTPDDIDETVSHFVVVSRKGGAQ